MTVFRSSPVDIAEASPDDDKKGEKFVKCGMTNLPLLKKFQDVLILSLTSSTGLTVIYFLLGATWLTFGTHHPDQGVVERVSHFLMSITVENLGLLILRHKIQMNKNVKGISGETMIMYTVTYMIRIWLGIPVQWYGTLMELSIEGGFSIISLLLALDILRSIFITYRSTYQDDSDVLKAKYLIPCCCLLAIFVRPQFHEWNDTFAVMWTSCTYMDGLALMPQVVMISFDGKVAAPIAHFVAATFVSRVEDFSNTIFWKNPDYQDHDQTVVDESQEVFSWYLVVMVQVVQLLLVADFMYYYIKARTSGKVPAEVPDTLVI